VRACRLQAVHLHAGSLRRGEGRKARPKALAAPGGLALDKGVGEDRRGLGADGPGEARQGGELVLRQVAQALGVDALHARARCGVRGLAVQLGQQVEAAGGVAALGRIGREGHHGAAAQLIGQLGVAHDPALVRFQEIGAVQGHERLEVQLVPLPGAQHAFVRRGAAVQGDLGLTVMLGVVCAGGKAVQGLGALRLAQVGAFQQARIKQL